MLHIVAQIVEPEFIVGAVGNVGRISCPAFVLAKVGDDHADFQAEEIIDLTHPFRIAAGQIVIDGDNVHALAADCIEITGERRDQGLAFTGPHFGDFAAMEHDTADQLHIIMALSQCPFGRFAYDRESFRQYVVERFTASGPFLERQGFCSKLFVGKGFDCRLERVDRVDHFLHRFYISVIG